MRFEKLCVFVFILILATALTPGAVVQATGTDEIKNYTIDILPSEDGSLMNTYAINWCVISNSAGPLTWITVGMPNEQYEIVSSSGDVASVKPYDEGFDYKIRIDLPGEVNAGDCVNFSVQVHQFGLANLDKNTNEIVYQFTPGWFNEVPVDHLQVTWHLPSDTTQLKSISPKPTTQTDKLAVWVSDLQPGEKFPISVVYDKATFPNFNSNITSLLPTNSNPPESGFSTAVTTNNGASTSLAPTILPPFTLSTCICLCIILILILIVISVVLRSIGSAGRSYSGGGFFGGYPGGGVWSGRRGGGFGSGSGGGVSIPNRVGGGSGLFGGRGMSCACVSSGCACACAGGGRAGCSRKGFDVSGLFTNRREKNKK